VSGSVGRLDVKKRLSVAALTLLALVIGGLLLIPALIDWSRFKAPLAGALEAACGRPVALAGDVRFSLLPVPTLSVTGLSIANPAGAAGTRLLDLERLEARVALLPLFSGRIEIRSLALDHPTLVLETLADGRRGWLPAPEDRPAPPGPSSGPPAPLRLDRVDIADGTVLWRDDAAGTTTRLTAVRGRLGVASRTGPFTLHGEGVIGGLALRAEATIDGLGDGAATPVNLALALADGSASLHFAGLATTGPAPRLQGEARAEAAHPALLATLLTTALGDALGGGSPVAATTLPPALGQPLTVRAALDAGTAGVTLTGLDLQLGGTDATGSARFTPGTPPALELRLAAPRLDLAPWLVGDSTDPAAALTDLAGLRLPFGASLRLDLAVESLVVKHQTLHEARLAIRLADGTLTVERLAALGPGGSELTIAGSLGRVDTHPVVDATLEADADNLRLLLDALKLEAGTVPADRLRRVSVIARLRGRPDEFQVTGIDLRIDTTRITGGIACRNHGRPAFGVRLDIDHLDADAYRGDRRLPDGDTWTTLRDRLSGLLAGGDVNLQAHLGHLVVDGLPVRDLTLDLTADHGALTIRNARVAELAGISAHVEGTLAGITPLRGADLGFGAEIGSAEALERLSGQALPQPMHRLGAFKVNGHATGDGGRLALALTAEGAGGRVDLSGALAPEAGRLAEPIQLHAVFPETSPVIRLFAPDYRTGTGDEPGTTDVSAVLAGQSGQLHLTGLAGTVAGVTVQGRLDADLTGRRPSLDARLQTGEIVLERLLPVPGPPAPRHWLSLWSRTVAPEHRRWSVDPLDLGWLAAADVRLALDAAGLTVADRRLGAPALRAALADGTLRLEQFDGELMQGRFGAVGRLATTAGTGATASPPGAEAALTVTLVGARIDRGLLYAGSVPGAVDVTAGTLDLDLDLKARGDSELALVGDLAGNGRVAIRNGRLQGIDLPDLVRRLAAIHHPQDVVGLLTLSKDQADGETPFDRLAGTVIVDHGIATTTDLTLAAPSGTGEALGSIDLPNRTLGLAMHFRVPHDPPLPAIGVTVEGTLDHPHRSIDTRDLQDYVAQRLTAAVTPKPAAPGAINPGAFLRGLFHSLTPPPSQPPSPTP
jgi:uncharacterized protein involved in outer membrane biogenesis